MHSLERVKASVNESLSQLKFIPNLLLIHNPFIPADGQLAEFWGWLEGLVEDGTLKGCSLGISNFRPVDIETVMKVAKIKPVVNRKSSSRTIKKKIDATRRASASQAELIRVEIEYHPYVMTHVEPVIQLHRKYDIITQAFASLAPTTRHPTGGPLKPILARIAETLSKESGVEVDSSGVLLLWIMAKGGVCITSSGDSGRIEKMANLEKVRNLSKEEVGQIDEAGKKVHFRQWVSFGDLSKWGSC